MMKYCIKCEMDLGNGTELVERDNTTFCPKCNEMEVLEITSSKLELLVKDITDAFYNIKETTVQNNAQKLIQNAKRIELGEKKLKKEYMKREKALKELQYELAVIQNIGKKLNYNLKG